MVPELPAARPLRPLVALVLAGALAAGCLDLGNGDKGPAPLPAVAGSVLLDGVAVHDAEGQLVPAQRYPGALPEFEQRFVGLPHFDLATWPGFEPTVDFTPDGTAFFGTFSSPMQTEYSPAWQGPRQTIVLVATSDDRGRTWRDVSPAELYPDFDTSPTGVSAALLHGGDVVTAVDPVTGDVYVSHLAAPCAVVHRTADEGGSWSSSTFCDTQGQVQVDHQAFFTGMPGGESAVALGSVVYFCYSGLVFTQMADVALAQETSAPLPTSQRCTVSLDQAETFAPVTPPFLLNEPCWPYMTQGAATGRDGTAYLPQGFCDRMDVAISRDSGLTWEVVTLDDAHGLSPDSIDQPEGRVALDRAGNVYVAWIDAGMMPRYAFSRDQGRTWSPSIPVHAPGVTATARPTLVAGDDGRIALTYLALGHPTGPAFMEGIGPTPPTDPTPPQPDLGLIAQLEWHAVSTFSMDALADEPVFASVRISGDDPVHLGYEFGGIEDYADSAVDPTTGAVWFSSGDTCHPDEGLCPVDPIVGSRYWQKPSRGYVAVQVGGTGLLQDATPVR